MIKFKINIANMVHYESDSVSYFLLDNCDKLFDWLDMAEQDYWWDHLDEPRDYYN